MNEERQALLDALAGPRLPPVPLGWVAWLSIVVALLLIGAAMVHLFRRCRRRRRLLAWRREADAVLDSLRSQLAVEPLDAHACRHWLAQASAFARRLMLIGRPRSEIAPLTGQAWQHRLRELDAMNSLDDDELLLLCEASFRPDSTVDVSALRRIVDALAALVDATKVRSLRAGNQGATLRQ